MISAYIRRKALLSKLDGIRYGLSHELFCGFLGRLGLVNGLCEVSSSTS